MYTESDMDIASPPAPYELSRVLDIERRRLVHVAPAAPNADYDICDVLVLGGKVGNRVVDQPDGRRLWHQRGSHVRAPSREWLR